MERTIVRLAAIICISVISVVAACLFGKLMNMGSSSESEDELNGKLQSSKKPEEKV